MWGRMSQKNKIVKPCKDKTIIINSKIAPKYFRQFRVVKRTRYGKSIMKNACYFGHFTNLIFSKLFRGILFFLLLAKYIACASS